jgi:hypothetical protein
VPTFQCVGVVTYVIFETVFGVHPRYCLFGRVTEGLHGT